MNGAELQASVVVAAPTARCLRALEEQDVEPATFEVVESAGAANGRICIFLAGDVVAAPGLVAAHIAGHAERVVGLGTLANELSGGARPFASARRFFPGNVSVPRDAVDGDVDVIALVAGLEESGYELRRLPRAAGVRIGDRRRMAEEGAAHAELAARYPALRSRLLGWFPDATPRELILRRAALAAHASPALLGAIGRVLPRSAAARWSIFASNYAYWSAVRDRVKPEDWDGLTRGVAVLLYHAVGDERSRFIVTPNAFARQLRLLSLLRYDVVPYADVARAVRNGGLPRARTVALTFDDGYADNADVAAPLLERHRCPATIFLVSGRLGGVNDWSGSPPLNGRRLLATEQLGPLRSRGIDFGAHTRTHPDLPNADGAVIEEEVTSSRSELEALLDEPVHAFAYPYGGVDDRTVAAVREAGFDSACTTDPRLVQLDDDPLLLPRIEIRSGDSLWRFVRKLWFGGA